MQTELPSPVPALQDHKASPVPKAQWLAQARTGQGQQQHQGPAANPRFANPRFPSSGRIPDKGTAQPLGWGAGSIWALPFPEWFVWQSWAPGDATHHSFHPPGCSEGSKGGKQGNNEPYAKPARAICCHWNTFYIRNRRHCVLFKGADHTALGIKGTDVLGRY